MTEPPMFDDSSAPIADGAHQAPAWVGELLRSLPQDDPPIPDDVASRLDAVLATLAATRAAASPLDTPRTLGTSAIADSGEGGGATVVPIESATGRRRTNNKRSPLGWIGGLAAAALVVVGGTAIVHNLGQPDTSGPTASGIGLSPGTASITPRYVASGTGYTPKSLPAQVHTLLTRAGISGNGSPTTQATTSESTPPTASSLVPVASPAVGTDLAAASTKPTRDCLTDLSGSTSALPLVVDEATYEGHQVFVVIFATTGSTTTVDVWVVKPTCNATNSALITFAHVTR